MANAQYPFHCYRKAYAKTVSAGRESGRTRNVSCAERLAGARVGRHRHRCACRRNGTAFAKAFRKRVAAIRPGFPTVLTYKRSRHGVRFGPRLRSPKIGRFVPARSRHENDKSRTRFVPPEEANTNDTTHSCRVSISDSRRMRNPSSTYTLKSNRTRAVSFERTRFVETVGNSEYQSRRPKMVPILFLVSLRHG